MVYNTLINNLSTLYQITEDKNVKCVIQKLIPDLLKNQDEAIVKSEFLLRKFDKEYRFSDLTNKVFTEAVAITKGEKAEEVVLNHPEEFLFLTNKVHYLSKQIISLWTNWHNDCRVEEKTDGKLYFHTGESVGAKITNQEELQYSIDISGIKDTKVEQKEITPSFRLNNHDGKFYVCAVTDCPTDTAGIDGHHTWLRLINDKGEVISIGKFPKAFKWDEMFRLHDTVFFTADQHEHLKRKWDSRQEKRFEVSEEQYKDVLKELQIDYKESFKENKEYWSHASRNCTDYVVNILLKHNIVDRIPMESIQRSLWHYILPDRYKKTIEYIDKTAPSFTKKITHILGQLISRIDFIARIIIFQFGGFSDKKDNKVTDIASRIVGSFTNSYYISHPYYFRKWLNKI